MSHQQTYLWVGILLLGLASALPGPTGHAAPLPAPKQDEPAATDRGSFERA
jgi:hypothetical protein